jgi:RNA polymerase sigma factor for flagellar operon FliA
MNDRADLLNQYRENPSKELMGKIMVAYEPIVVANAKSIAKQLPKHIELDDLISDGMFGLIDAITKFDNSFGYKFETYASFRIRGEILDKLRGADWAPRSLRSKSKEVEKATQKLSSELNREPTKEEVAQLLGWDVEEVYQIAGETSSATMSNLDDLVNINGTKFSLSDIIPDQNVVTEDYSEIKGKLIAAFGEMNDESRTVLSLYYVQDLSLREIGDLMGVTESRTCQIHTSALSSIWEHCLA